MDSGFFRHWGVLCMTPLPFTVWGVPRVSLRGVPCAPLSLTTLLPWGLVARIQRRIFLVRTYAMGFDVCPRIGHHFHPRAAPLFRRFGVSMGGLPSPPLLLLIIMGGMGGLPSPRHLLLIIMEGLQFLPHLLIIIMGSLQSLPIILIIIMGGLHSPPLPLGL